MIIISRDYVDAFCTCKKWELYKEYGMTKDEIINEHNNHKIQCKK